MLAVSHQANNVDGMILHTLTEILINWDMQRPHRILASMEISMRLLHIMNRTNRSTVGSLRE